MITVAAYDRQEAELSGLAMTIKDLAANLTDDYWQLEQALSIEKLKAYLESKPLLDMVLHDVTSSEAIASVTAIRSEYDLAYIMLLADATTSPMTYLKPGIRANSLLIRPWTKEQEIETLREFITEYLKATRTDDAKDTFVVDTDDGKVSIPYNRILYFEAMEKKVYVCAGKEEYGFYATLDGLEETLPENFRRCHRGFVVNTDKVKKVLLSQSLLLLDDDYDVPLSRSYKPEFKNFGKNLTRTLE